MSFEPPDYLRHILVEADYFVAQTSGLRATNSSWTRRYGARLFGAFKSSERPAKKVPEEFRAQHPTIEWRAMSGMRDR
jgi:hypothetical protein